MARRVPPNQHDTAQPTLPTEEETPEEMYPPEASAKIHTGAPESATPEARRDTPEAAPKAYRVLPSTLPGGIWRVVYGSILVELKPNKIVNELTYDLAKLRGQGVRLEEV